MDPNPMNELEQQVMDAITANHQRIQESRTDEYEDGYVIPATGSYPMLSLNLAQTDLTEEDDPYPTDEEASQAYEVLKDKEKRAAYDNYGHEAFEAGGGLSLIHI